MHGACHCGAITITVSGSPRWVGRCHCQDCQTLSGGAFMAFAEYDLDHVSFTANKPLRYRSSHNATRSFCPTCGTPIEWRRNDLPDQTSLTLSLFPPDAFSGYQLDDLYEESVPVWQNSQT